MMITAVFLAIVFVIAIVYFSKKLNSYSEEKYDYEPINMLNILLMITPFILIFVGFLFFLLIFASSRRDDHYYD
ncbi:hypothetical protein NG788_09105 [Aliarcobacter cryaerophilus]|uniref:hypothetical protein n=1 Tax=Aliarcobacter cryaerophilus TaxID=28198 RepID=UPI003DA251F6